MRLREQVGELDVLRERNAELTDLVDEQQQHLRNGAGSVAGAGPSGHAGSDSGGGAAVNVEYVSQCHMYTPRT